MLIKSKLRISNFFVLPPLVAVKSAFVVATFAFLSFPTLKAEEVKPDQPSSSSSEVRTDFVKETKDLVKEPVKEPSAQYKEPSAPTLRAPGKIVVGVVSSESRAEFDSKIIPFFKDQWANCSSCELRNLSIYDEKGSFSERLSLAQLETALDGVQFLLINVNWRYKADEHKAMAENLKKIAAKNIIIVGAAGYPKEGESSAPLSRTLLCQVPDLIIIGEINERERLLGSSYFGPEMLTAIKPPRDYIGKGLGPSFFAAKLAQNYTRKLPVDWLAHFRNQKLKSRKIWPQVEEFFQR